MPGFGDGPFGRGYFGEWQWSLAAIVEGIPAVYQEQDELSGAGTLRALLEGLVPSLDGLRQKVRDYDDLRDPLKAPTDKDFNETVLIIRTDNLDDGTSRVFLSEGPDGDKYIGIRPGMVLIDLTGNRFTISSVHSSALPSDVDDPPIDPATGEETGRHVIVENIGASSTELVPFSSSTLVTDENPNVVPAVGSITAIAEALLNDTETFTLSDGVHPPVVFEFDTTPDGVSPGNIQINTSGLVSAIDIANAMVEAINDAPNLNLLATNGGGSLAVVTITNLTAGVAGNGALWSTTVADAGFVIVQPSGGAAGAFPLDAVLPPRGIDDGVGVAPYVFNLTASYVSGLQLAPNRISITWSESGVPKSGFFTTGDLPGGDLADTSTINRSATVPVLAAGQIRMFNDSGAPIDPDSIKVTYTFIPLTQTEDAEIRSQNILAFLASDYGIKLDRNDPEVLQRSYVNNAFKIWDVKGTELGYFVLGKYAGYFVAAEALYSVSESVAVGLPSSFLFAFPAGTPSAGVIAAITASSLIEGETFTLDDGVNPPTIFEFDTDTVVSGGNVAVDISSAVTAIDVATEIVSAINSVGGSLNLNADNVSGSSATVTITNGQLGIVGNVTTWSDTVIDTGFAITQPTGGTDSNWFTTINPGRGQFDEIALDVIPLDLLCSDSTYPSIVQTVNATDVEFLQQEGSRVRSIVTVTTTSMHESFNTDGVFIDSNAQTFDVESFTRVDSTTYTFEVSSIVSPVVGAGTVEWNVLEFDFSIVGVGTDVVDLGVQYQGFLGRRYRITKTFVEPPVSGIGNWAFIDSAGVVSYLESFELVSGTTYRFDIIAESPPAAGTAHIFYYCEIVTSCDFCRASSILIRMSPDEILNFPEALEGDALSRLILRLNQMVPGHIRIAAFLYDPGPAIAAWGPIAASSAITEAPVDDSLYTAIYDEDEYPADEIPTDSAAIVASSEVNIINLNVLEEYLVGEDPLIEGTWLATGLWHITPYASSTSFRSFNYGQGDNETTAPNYDTGAVSSGTLTSPTVNVPAATTVLLRFRHYGDMLAGGADDDVTVLVVEETGPSTVQTITKTDLGLFATGTNGGFTTFSVPIGPAVIGVGNFHLEFVFNSITGTTGRTGEGWYVDDIEIKVTP
jgi:hypothetical protein